MIAIARLYKQQNKNATVPVCILYSGAYSDVSFSRLPPPPLLEVRYSHTHHGPRSKIRSSASFTVSHLHIGVLPQNGMCKQKGIIYRPKLGEVIGIIVLDTILCMWESEWTVMQSIFVCTNKCNCNFPGACKCLCPSSVSRPGRGAFLSAWSLATALHIF